MRRDYVAGAIALIALVLVSLLGQRHAVPTVATRASDDYSFGGYHAWYDLLAREGVRVERFRRHHDALPRSGVDTLIVAFPERGVATAWDAAEYEALRAWVRNGGRVVDAGGIPRPEREPDRHDHASFVPARGRTGALAGPWAALVRALAQRGGNRIVAPRRSRAATLLRDGAGTIALRYAYGRGEIIGLTDAAIFENRAIAKADDARLAFLAARPRRGGVVAFDEAIRGDIVEKPWWEALTAPELVALGILALAGLLWILYGIVPLGPAVRLRAVREPTSEEFLDAVAALYARARARDHARDALARDARRSLERAPRTPQNAALAERVAVEGEGPVASDAALVAFAQVARAARENQGGMTVAGSPSIRARRPRAGGARGVVR